jgi:hypothetical protein
VSEPIHHLVTERMIAVLERGTIPWHKAWRAHTGQLRPMTTGQLYRGVNLFPLALTAAEEGHASPLPGHLIRGIGSRRPADSLSGGRQQVSTPGTWASSPSDRP